MSEHDLTAALRALGSRLDETPDFVAVVVERLADETSATYAGRPVRRRGTRIVVIAAIVILLLAATAVASSQSVRNWLRHRGVDAQQVETLPDTTIGSLNDLGLPISADAAVKALGRPLPHSSRLGEPDWIRQAVGSDEVTLAWTARPGLPAASTFPGVGALATIWRESADHEAFIVAKALAATTDLQFVALPNGASAAWISGVPHAVKVFDRDTVRFRMAANVLIWTADGLNVRLETTLPRAEAVSIAASFEPAR